jgi:hypothetical protein
MDIEKLARDSGFERNPHGAGSYVAYKSEIAHFAALVAEECARVCVEQADACVPGSTSAAPVKAHMCATAIREKFKEKDHE